MQTTEMTALPLRDIKLPAEPGFWPLAPGWWLLLLVSLIMLIWLGILWYRYTQKKKRWQQIEQQLDAIEFAFTENNNKQKLLTEISLFLRRFVKFQLKQNHASALTGTHWVDYLNQLNNKRPFLPFEQALTTGVYQSAFEYDGKKLVSTTRQFMKQHVMKPNKPKNHQVTNV